MRAAGAGTANAAVCPDVLHDLKVRQKIGVEDEPGKRQGASELVIYLDCRSARGAGGLGGRHYEVVVGGESRDGGKEKQS